MLILEAHADLVLMCLCSETEEKGQQVASDLDSSLLLPSPCREHDVLACPVCLPAMLSSFVESALGGFDSFLIL